MQKDDVVRVVVKVLGDLQALSGRAAGSIGGGTRPVGDLEGFDSLNGVEATIELSGKLGIDLPGVNYFVSEEGDRALSVSEVADRICGHQASRGK